MASGRVEIVHPAPPGVNTGNRVTALRWAGVLRELGCEVRVLREWSGREVDLLVALNARKSGASVVRCHRLSPRTRIACAVTGTDLNERLDGLPEATDVLPLCDAIVALQPASAARVPSQLRTRTHVILQSAPS